MSEISQHEFTEDAETNSSKTVKFWLPKTKEGRGEYIGEIYVENGEFVAKGDTPEDTDWLNKKLGNIWIPQRGIPVYKRKNDQFERDAENKFIVDSFRNHVNSTADDLLQALFEYTNAGGVFGVSIEDKK